MIERDRPDPDELLREVQKAEEKAMRGRLKVFLGASAGVGKTYAMLSEAHEQLARGVEVVVGYVETHGRKETDALVNGLELLPRQVIDHKGVSLTEFDLDGALARRPKLILIDELAHTNAPGCRHSKRYQDVEDLIREGIDVYTTVNVQHFESLNDVVAQITGIQVRETVPDSVLEMADEVELIDIPPEHLLQRLKEGKVYVPHQVEAATRSFFRKGNLIALRELALRKTADRVDAQMQSYRTEEGVRGLWAARERVLVCIAPNRLASKVVRAAKRMGEASHAEMIALYVESDRQAQRPAAEKQSAQEALVLAESLGMETVSLSGHDIVSEVIRFARSRNVTQIIVGKPIKPRWKEILFGSVVDYMVRSSGEIDVHVITGEANGKEPRKFTPVPATAATMQSYGLSVLITALCTLVCFALVALYPRMALANLIMLYLVGVAIVAGRTGPREAMLASFLSVASFDLFFVPPRFTFAVSDTQYLFTFLVMLGVALMISSLTLKIRQQADSASDRERRTAALFQLSRELARSRSKVDIGAAGRERIREVFDCDASVMLVSGPDALDVVAASESGFEILPNERAVAQWALAHGASAGAGTDTLPSSQGHYVPIRGAGGPVGVLGIKLSTLTSQQESLLDTFANQIGLAAERAMLAKESQDARLQVESEKLRNSLLSSVSHDLRTPLTAIAGAASSLVDTAPDERSKELASTIFDESQRLNGLVRNLLDMSRLESGRIELKLEWQSLEELLGSAINRTRSLLASHAVVTNLEPDLPLLRLDGILIEQVLVNLLENAARHTPEGSTIEVNISRSGGFVRVAINDDGSGLPFGEEERVFEKFHRAPDAAPGGFGLGLAICRAILEAHEGKIWARNRFEGGASFVFELRIDKNQPTAPEEAI